MIGVDLVKGMMMCSNDVMYGLFSIDSYGIGYVIGKLLFVGMWYDVQVGFDIEYCCIYCKDMLCQVVKMLFSYVDLVYGLLLLLSMVFVSDSDQIDMLYDVFVFFQDIVYLIDKWIVLGGICYIMYNQVVGCGWLFIVNIDFSGLKWLLCVGVVYKWIDLFLLYGSYL